MARRGRAGRKRERGRRAPSGGPAGDDAEGEVGLRVQAPAPDRQAAGEARRVGAGRPGTARCGRTCPSWRPCDSSPNGSTGCPTRRRTTTRRAVAGRRSCGMRPPGPCPSWSRRRSSRARRTSRRSWVAVTDGNPYRAAPSGGSGTVGRSAVVAGPPTGGTGGQGAGRGPKRVGTKGKSGATTWLSLLVITRQPRRDPVLPACCGSDPSAPSRPPDSPECRSCRPGWPPSDGPARPGTWSDPR